MLKLNNSLLNFNKAIIIIGLYFFWPTFSELISNIFNFNSGQIFNLLFNYILLLITLLIYRKDIYSSYMNLSKKSIRSMFYLFLSLIIVQMLTNLLSVTIMGVNNHNLYGGLLPTYLEKWPILIGINLVIYYPIVETIVFSKTLKDNVNRKWAFILCSSLFFWLVNLLAFDFNFMSIIATMSCFTTSIVINYFYYKNENISLIIIVKMIYNLIFLMLP